MRSSEWGRYYPEEDPLRLVIPDRPFLEGKYSFQVGLKDLDFDVDTDKLKVFGMSFPFRNSQQAEQALRNKAVIPTQFTEMDGTLHTVLVFDARPVGSSGFMDCVTHSLALTDQGLFEVGRYSALNLNTASQSWQWFLHRRFGTYRDAFDYCETHNFTSEEFMQNIYQALTNDCSPAPSCRS